jgi:hypothetical protein
MVKIILVVDAVINFILGMLLLIFSNGIINFLGVPSSSSNFYPNILGAVFIGITAALLIRILGKDANKFSGLGLLGAISINLSGGLVLALWLIFGNMNLPDKGFILLWSLVAVLIIISTAELLRVVYKK